MDVPSWHPANEDARSRQANAAAASQRTEFKLMPGSTADMTTDAGRELIEELSRGADGGSAAVEGRGFFDSSDRLYLLEQRRLEDEMLETKKQQDLEELRKFRSTALKVQARKNAALVAAATDVPLDAAPKRTSATTVAKVVIKAKKRSAPEANDTTNTKQAKTSATKAPPLKPPVVKTTTTSASLVADYASSSESDKES